jgi:methylated-DNA-[protein]-cysteine S-methyltransferase
VKKEQRIAGPTMQNIWYDNLSTPIGRLRLVADEQGLREIWFETGRHQREPAPSWMHSPKALAFARVQLEEYFAGTRQMFELPLHPLGTPFQLAVWQELARIPYGTTLSYGELARRIGQPQAVRAVGAANGRNPLPIVLPCHRVIGANGSLTGFGGGLPTKRFLLAMEEGVARGDLFGLIT